jgi:hypothetical protein
MTDADETRNPESPEERKLTPEQSEAFDTARGFADLQMMAAQEEKAAGPGEPEGRGGLPLPAGCSRSAVAALIALVLIVVAFGFYLARLGSDPSKALRGVSASTAPQKGTHSGADSGGQDAPTQVGGSPTGAHDDSVPHVGQEWKPTYTQAGEWQIAMAREDLLLRDNVEDRYAKDGHKMLLVEVNVVNNGSTQRRVDPSYFSLKADERDGVARDLLRGADRHPGGPRLHPTRIDGRQGHRCGAAAGRVVVALRPVGRELLSAASRAIPHRSAPPGSSSAGHLLAPWGHGRATHRMRATVHRLARSFGWRQAGDRVVLSDNL